MKKEQAIEFISKLPPDMVEEADLPLPARQPMLKIAKVGLIAACLCLALVGTGAAAVASGWIKVSQINYSQVHRRDETIASTTTLELITDGITYVPWEKFSPQCRDYVNSCYGMPQYRGFDSWDELEEFLGLNIFDNSVLNQANPVVYENNSSLGCRTEVGSCFVGFHGLIEAPDFMWLSAYYQLETHDSRHLYVSLHSTVNIRPTESGEKTKGYEFPRVGTESDLVTLETETYVTPSGLQAVIAITNEGDIFVFFQLNGTYFDLWSHCDSEHMDEGLRMIKEVLDAFS